MIRLGIRRMRGDRRGAVAPMVGVMAVALFGFAGLAVDVGHVLAVRSALQASTDAAALAGAQLVGTGTASQAIAAATAYSAVSGNNNAVANVSASLVSGYPQVTCLTSTGISCGGLSKGNAVVVQQQASVPTTFASVLGFKTFTVTTTATASASGGSETPHDVMVVLDTTRSMNDPDPDCGISGALKVDCAKAGLQTILMKLAPSKDQIGLMIFPGLTTAAAVPLEYDCSTNTPVQDQIAFYNGSPPPVYGIIPLSSDYRTSDAATALNPNSDLALASGGVSSCPAGLRAIGNRDTYFVDVLNQAQSVLTTTGRSNTQKVIIFLSDGDSNSYAPNYVNANQQPNQCHNAVTAAQTATAAGTWVYAVAYQSGNGGCMWDSGITSCQTMQQIASDSTKFYSDNTTSCKSTTSSLVGLLNTFEAISESLLPPRLLPDGTS